jgi:TonB family protein
MKDQREFHITMIDSASLPERLATELRFALYRLKLSWPELKRDPFRFSQRIFANLWLQLRYATTRTSLAALATAVLLVSLTGLILILVGERSKQNGQVDVEPLEIARLLVFDLPPKAEAPKDDHGVGAGTIGRVGFRNNKGQGSGPKPTKSTGGGSGGLRDPLPAQIGKSPAPSEIPATIPKFPPAQQLAVLPVAGIDIDPALWKNMDLPVYGDPRSKSSAPSNGPGDGGGMGTVKGTGIGEGLGPGFGPGRDGNIGGGPKGPPGCCGSGGGVGNNPDEPDRVYPPPQVTERARVLAKPEPQYTEEARKGGITGSVVLRVVFSQTGEVTNIRAVSTLPFGLTERAIAAARLIRFRPATKDGRPVNVSMQLEYNFNLY